CLFISLLRHTTRIVTALLFRSNARFVSVGPDGAGRHALFQPLDAETPPLRPLRRTLALLALDRGLILRLLLVLHLRSSFVSCSAPVDLPIRAAISLLSLR